ncbi:hypothetical protein [Pseudodesulfovibrio methanolicus]|uniref:Uncharacterized protein n=1 Tax=Pseudodesulfovibrio methanolicus TaxID=3126690 RepID=A0ABZ2IZH7_9BACT
MSDESYVILATFEPTNPISVAEVRRAFGENGKIPSVSGLSVFVNILIKFAKDGRIVVLLREKLDHPIVHVEPSGSQYLDSEVISSLDAAFKEDAAKWN